MQKRLPVSETLRVRAGARATGRKPQTRLGLAQAETVWVAQKVLLAFPPATPERAPGRRTRGFVTAGGVGSNGL